MLRAVTTDFNDGPKGLTRKNSRIEARGSSRAHRMGGGRTRSRGVFGRSLSDNLDLVASGCQPDPERLFDGAQILVGDSEKLVEPRFGKGHGWSRFRNGDRSFGRNVGGSAGARRDGPVETERPAR